MLNIIREIVRTFREALPIAMSYALIFVLTSSYQWTGFSVIGLAVLGSALLYVIDLFSNPQAMLAQIWLLSENLKLTMMKAMVVCYMILSVIHCVIAMVAYLCVGFVA